MATKTTGLEFNRFYAEPWPDGQYHEDVELTINGESKDEWDDIIINDTDIIVIIGGIVCNDNDGSCVSFESFFKKWRKKQQTRILMVEVTADKLDNLVDVIKSAGGKIK